MKAFALLAVLGISCHAHPDRLEYLMARKGRIIYSIDDDMNHGIKFGIDETCSRQPTTSFLSDRRFKGGDLSHLISNWHNLGFSQARNGKLNIAGYNWASRFPTQRFFDHVGEKDSVTILYPGAGDDIDALQLSPRLQEAGVDEVNFIHTEINDLAEEYFQMQLETLQKEGLISDLTRERKDFPEFEKSQYARQEDSIPHLTIFDFTIGDDFETTVTYAVNMSENSYFSIEDVKQADIFLFYRSSMLLEEMEERYLGSREDPSVVISHPILKIDFNVLDLEGYFSEDHCYTSGMLVHFVDTPGGIE